MEVTDVKKHFSDANAPMRNIAEGLRDGTPIALGYFAVAFSLGIIAKKAGLTAPMGFFSSFFTRASAGEYGVYTLVAIHATYVELIAMCLVTNLRYMLMSAALSQKLAPATSWFHRLLMACCITDEIFGISVNHRGYTPPAYTYSAALISSLFWAGGCATGIVAGGMLPTSIVAALSVALYGMFLAIIVPPARADRNVRAHCQPMEQRHTHHPAHPSHLIGRGMVPTRQKQRIKWNRIALSSTSCWRFWSRT